MKCFLISLLLAHVSLSWAAGSPRDQVIDYLGLYYAAQAGNLELVEALLARGAPVDALDVDAAGSLSYHASMKDSPLQVAAQNGHVNIVKALLRHKPWVDHRCCYSPSALGDAADKGNIEIVNLLLDAGADPMVKSENGDIQGMAIDFARRGGHRDVVERLQAAMAERAATERVQLPTPPAMAKPSK